MVVHKSSSASSPRVYLQRNIGGLGLIIPSPTGVIFMNHVDGTLLSPMGMEGLYVPIYDWRLPNPTQELWEYFEKPGSKKTLQTAEFLDDLILRSTRFKNIKVDRTQLEKIREAWVPVTIKSDEFCSLFEDFYPENGILIWENSD